MNKLIFGFSFLVMSFNTSAQTLDSILSIAQTLELAISTPQPRLQQKFQVSLDVNYIRAHIFKSTLGIIELTNNIGSLDENLMILNVNAIKKGKNEIGPLQFNLNGTQYTTNKIQFEVIDALPNVDKGIWFRTVFTSDSTFCIIIEQRIPAQKKVTTVSEKTTIYSTEPTSDKFTGFKQTYSIEGLQGSNSSSYTDYGSIYDSKGEQKEFISSFSITYFKIVDSKKHIIITKNKLENLPDQYKFEDIIIQ